MLSECAAALVADGWHVVLPSRRYSPLPAEDKLALDQALSNALPELVPAHAGSYQPGSAARRAMSGGGGHRPTAARTGRALWVEASWADPDGLAASAGNALNGEADLLVAWIHAEYRERVLDAVAPLLAFDARVVEVHGSGTGDSLDTVPEPYLTDYPTQRVVLGFVWQGMTTRWLTHTEVADGVLSAVCRALDGLPPALHQVGDLHPWDMLP
ncbi:MAG: hypothetical protein GEU98_02575 [Pseudonocardiaceae bacterium]|nr:hypothetical protein [Pseudonocardiaceae bacterium]